MRPQQRLPQLTRRADDRLWESDHPVGTRRALGSLRSGELVIEGRVTDASNLVLWCRIQAPARTDRPDPPGGPLHAVYKPIRGERPLDDFPDGTLALREEAAWHVSETLGWSIVPPTLVRDGPAGRGMVQLYIDTDEHTDVLRLILTRDERTRRMAMFDVIVNNADRKGRHILVTPAGVVHGVDHGICFSSVPKLRTVLWGWRGEAIPDDERQDIERLVAALDGGLAGTLAPLLSDPEIDRLRERGRGLLDAGVLPHPDPGRYVIPWPPF